MLILLLIISMVQTPCMIVEFLAQLLLKHKTCQGNLPCLGIEAFDICTPSCQSYQM